MSKSHEKAKVVDQHAAVHTHKPMSPLRRWIISGVAVFCLLIFSVTGPMSDVITSWFGSGPPVRGTVNLPSGTVDITVQDSQHASRLRSWGEQFGIFLFPEDADDTESNLTYAALMLLADELEVVVTNTQLQAFLSMRGYGQLSTGEYERAYRGLGFANARQFEAQVRASLRVQTLVGFLASASLPSESEIVAAWAKDYEEMDVQYAVWHASAFADAAAALVPEEEELNTFFLTGLNGLQRRDLEVEQAVSFDSLILTADALASDAVKAWFTPEEPTQEALDGFYQVNRFSLYRRPEPKEGEEVDPDLGDHLTVEELGDRLRGDYLLHKAITTLALELPQAADAAAFAAEKGAEYVKQEEMVAYSDLPDVERIGHMQLRRLFNAELNFWVQTPIQTEGMVYLARPLERRDRVMPELEDIKDEVIALWRETQQGVLAKEAADAFLEALPKGEDQAEGDPVVMDADAFAAALAGADRAVEQMGWISHTIRRTTDPIWPADAKILPMLRYRVGLELETLTDGEVIGPEDFGENGIVIAQLKGRRPANPDEMWPAERQRAERAAYTAASQRFQADVLSFEGMANLYGLTKVVTENEANELDDLGL
ncbi:MAG: hypothetical protein QM477_00820 [Planctomycetota bacterium]